MPSVARAATKACGRKSGGKSIVSIVNDVNDVKDMKVSEESALFSPDKDFDWQSSLHWNTPPQRLDDDDDDGDDDADGNITGVLCRNSQDTLRDAVLVGA